MTAKTSAAAVAIQAARPAPDENGGTVQLVAFKVNGHDYAVDIMEVQEIKAWSDVSSLPNMPPYVRGVLNLRGNIVPIFDLRCRFGQGPTDATRLHVVIILIVGGRTIGILVDAVSDILKAPTALLRDLPDQGEGREAYISSLLTIDSRMIALLDPARLLAHSLVAIAARQGI